LVLRNLDEIQSGHNWPESVVLKGISLIGHPQILMRSYIISSRLGLDHDRVLGSRYSFPIMAKYLTERGGSLADHKERDQLLYWYIHTFLWGRYAGSTESVINQDLDLIEKKEGAIDRLIGQLRQNRGNLRLNPND
jgi:hypothetical protein